MSTIETIEAMLNELPFYDREEAALRYAIDAIRRFEQMRDIANRNGYAALVAAQDAGYTMVEKRDQTPDPITRPWGLLRPPRGIFDDPNGT